MLSNAFRPASQDIALVDPPPDSISRIKFSPTSNLLAVASWDNAVRLYQVDQQGQSMMQGKLSHNAPVLDVTWTENGSHLCAAGCDNMATLYDAQTGTPQQVAQHDAPIKCVEFVNAKGTNVLATAGWDNKLKYWDIRQGQTPAMTIDLGDRAYSMDATKELMVVATANRRLKIIYPDERPEMIFKDVESPLKWQTRVVSCFPTGHTYAVGSIEGRVAIQYPKEIDDKKNYSFKCHRYDIPSGSMPGTPAVFNTATSQNSQNVFAVNTITFHKVHGTFCTGGSDGSITFWDGIGRTKVKAFTLKELNNGDSDARPPQWGTPVVSTAFNHNQEIFAYALSYDWAKGHGGAPPPGQNPTKVMLHSVKPDEVRKKDKLGR
ncbi:WD40-repeat-containing domain protein [Kockovaella imperatae]|uniref:WD40-repeat-containing domain protein n=1 Tax=Kockovaella imperatae TaxID=4999 RepID=A0A1Y1US52_9TREE|nr:WD40-repeat-containing domain protein [Kockovaella imperatae]ORX40809.1 WD40-repeat-containing domain protein [Kockovaella imperatae]